jgi:hypothetical protein
VNMTHRATTIKARVCLHVFSCDQQCPAASPTGPLASQGACVVPKGISED